MNLLEIFFDLPVLFLLVILYEWVDISYTKEYLKGGGGTFRFVLDIFALVWLVGALVIFGYFYDIYGLGLVFISGMAMIFQLEIHKNKTERQVLIFYNLMNVVYFVIFLVIVSQYGSLSGRTY